MEKSDTTTRLSLALPNHSRDRIFEKVLPSILEDQVRAADTHKDEQKLPFCEIRGDKAEGGNDADNEVDCKRDIPLAHYNTSDSFPEKD